MQFGFFLSGAKLSGNLACCNSAFFCPEQFGFFLSGAIRLFFVRCNSAFFCPVQFGFFLSGAIRLFFVRGKVQNNNNIYMYKIILLLLFIIFNGIMYQYLHVHVKEGYESLTSCLKQGYPTSFCYNVPIQACLTNCGNVDIHDLPRASRV